MMERAMTKSLVAPQVARLFVLAVLTSALIVVSMVLTASKAWAAVAIDTTAPARLELSLKPEGQPSEGIRFNVYRIADVSPSCEYSLTEAFAGYDVSFDDATAEDWTQLAQLLNEGVNADKIVAYATATTNAYGVAVFEELPVGLYLVTGEQFRIEGADVAPAPFMISLPDLSSDDDWVYDVKCEVKPLVTYDEKLPTTDGGKLPQTGQLWWPVPVLLAGGALLIGAGFAGRRRA